MRHRAAARAANAQSKSPNARHIHVTNVGTANTVPAQTGEYAMGDGGWDAHLQNETERYMTNGIGRCARCEYECGEDDEFCEDCAQDIARETLEDCE